MKLKVLLVVIVASSLSMAFGQNAPPSPKASEIVTNIPFTAQVLTTTKVQRPDGSTINMLHRTDIARNSAGSVRSEDRILPNSPSKPIGSASVEIRDVVKNLSIHIIPVTKVAIESALKPADTPFVPSTGFPSGTVTVGSPQNLGTNNISGYTATGYRETFQIPAGTRGPNQVQVTKDTWFSPDLKTTLMIETKDDLGNTAKSELTHIVLGEPDPALFTVPSAYTTINADAPSTHTSTSQSVAPKMTTQSHAGQAIPERELYRSFFLYEAHLEHVAEAHPEVPKGGAIKDHLRRSAGLSEAEWQQVSDSSLRIEAATHASNDQAKALIANDAAVCQSSPQSCSSSTPNLPKLKKLQTQSNQTIDIESAALESSLGPDSTAKLRTYLQTVIASHIQVITIPPAALNAAIQYSQGVSK